MYCFPIFFQTHLNYFIALFLATYNYRIFLAEDVVAAVDKHTEFEISFVLVWHIEIHYFLSEGVRNLVEAGLVQGQGVAHHDAFGAVGDVYFEGDDVRVEGEELVGMRAVQHEVVLSTLWQFGVFGRNVGLDVKGVVDIVQRLGISSDRNIYNFDGRINQHLHSAIPGEYNLVGIIHILIFIVGRVGNSQWDQGTDIAVEFPDGDDKFGVINDDYSLLIGHLGQVDCVEIILVLLYLVDEEGERRQGGCHLILVLKL